MWAAGSSTKSEPKTLDDTPGGRLPLKAIPGSYGIPFFGPIKDRHDYFYKQGKDAYFRTRAQKYGSTVFRANMPPGPFVSRNPKVIVLLDARSFPVLFDLDKVEKRDVFTGTYMPSVDLTGGYRVLSYLDPTEPKHAKLKTLIFRLLHVSRDKIIPEFRRSYRAMFQELEAEIAVGGKAAFADSNDQAGFNFLARSFFGSDPIQTKLGRDGPGIIAKWLLFQLSPILSLGLPNLLEEVTIRSFTLPSCLLRSDYKRLYDDFFWPAFTSSVLCEAAETLGLGREEACHNLLFVTCFNSLGGVKVFFPALLKWIGLAGATWHRKIADEIRSVVRSNGGEVTIACLERMPLTKSTVYETLRIDPPVEFQYGKAKKDLIIESHDAAFEVKKGEMLFGYQPFATKDPVVFARPEEFQPDRFVGEEGERLLKYVVWSNGAETEEPTAGNKQCPGKDLVVMIGRLLVVELFLMFDTFEIEWKPYLLGTAVTLTSLTKATIQTSSSNASAAGLLL
uniref:Allene oxide synthase n=1 Tax=Kalanchoe fedtschenkoi TaxID=63787 RepID=A0A7N0TAD2_KALFE